MKITQVAKKRKEEDHPENEEVPAESEEVPEERGVHTVESEGVKPNNLNLPSNSDTNYS